MSQQSVSRLTKFRFAQRRELNHIVVWKMIEEIRLGNGELCTLLS
jgi:hypothetical protein